MNAFNPQSSTGRAPGAKVFRDLFVEPIGQMVLANGRLRLIVFDPDQRKVLHWIP